MRTSRHGFTLIELSIVLVIIGLLVGGVIVGRSIVRNSNLQTIVTDTTRYINAAAQFQKKYNSLPGDMADATATWGTNATCAANGAGTGTQTCNGNGDGKVYDYPTYGLSDATNNMERYLFWQHLGECRPHQRVVYRRQRLRKQRLHEYQRHEHSRVRRGRRRL